MKVSKLVTAGVMLGVVIGAVLLALDAVTPKMTLARDRGPSLEAASDAAGPDALLAQADGGGDQLAQEVDLTRQDLPPNRSPSPCALRSSCRTLHR